MSICFIESDAVFFSYLFHFFCLYVLYHCCTYFITAATCANSCSISSVFSVFLSLQFIIIHLLHAYIFLECSLCADHICSCAGKSFSTIKYGYKWFMVSFQLHWSSIYVLMEAFTSKLYHQGFSFYQCISALELRYHSGCICNR